MECTIQREEMMEALYGEADPSTVRRVEEHQALCAACREEMASLRRVRRDLSHWTLPEISRTRLAVSRFGVRQGLAAAAALLLALGGALGLSGSEVRYEAGRLSIRLGRSGEDAAQLLARQEARHQEEIRALKASLASGTPRDDSALLQRVQELIRESEARQAVLMNASLADLSEKAEAQRRYDLARVSAGLSYLDGTTGQQMARTTELMGYVLQASQPK